MNTVQRLTDMFTPSHYSLSLTINRSERAFEGTVEVDGELNIENSFAFHSKDLTITSVQVSGVAAQFNTNENDELTINGSFPVGTHTVSIAFNGTITDQMHGMYPCFFEHGGSQKELIATQFESHHAREVFPCIDEPAAKATFDVTLTTERHVSVLGNMPVASQVEEGDRLVTSFERTPRMSSYLLAWVIGELQKKSAKTTGGVEVNIWATPAQPAESLDFALDIATRSVEFYDDYFGIPYPLPKADHVALPDFSSGAMENWGLITYREVALLAHPTSTSVSSKHYIATVIAHELAHQWFGNLVTMKWWNDLWLNESFATLMEYIAVDALEPSWNVWLDFASNESVMALRRDAIDGVQSVQVDVNHPDEISTLFDGAIVYAKGARLLRMLEVYVGKEAFQSGLKNYFKTHAYKNTEANDLWKSIATSSGKDIAALMSDWISKPGYPLVSFNETTLTQEQFFIGPHTASTRTWPIPLGASDASLPALLTTNSIDVSDAPLYTLLNSDDSAHFITKYSPARMSALLGSIADLPPLTRLQLLDQQTLLARGDVISSAALIPILNAYENETTESVWDIMAIALGEFRKFVENNHEAEIALRSMSGRLAKKLYDQLGWDVAEGEPETHTKLRAGILSLMLYSEDQTVIDEALRRYGESDLVSLPAETRSLFIATAVKHNEDAPLVEQLLTAYRTTSSTDLKQDIASGLTATRSNETAKLLLDASKDSRVVKTQDAFRWFVYLVRNHYTRDTAWQWLVKNWPWVKATFGGDKSYDDYARYAATGLMTREQLEAYKAFFTPMSQEPALKRTIELGIVEITARVELIESQQAEVTSALLEL